MPSPQDTVDNGGPPVCLQVRVMTSRVLLFSWDSDTPSYEYIILNSLLFYFTLTNSIKLYQQYVSPKSVFPNFSSTQEPLKQFSFSETNFYKRLQIRRKEAVGNAQILFPYCQLADKFPAMFLVVFRILRGVLRFVRTFFTLM